MANDRMAELVTDQKVRDLESLVMETSVKYTQTILGLRDEISALREVVKKLDDENRKLKRGYAVRDDWKHREIRSCLKEAMADYEESTGCRDARWYQQARFVLEM